VDPQKLKEAYQHLESLDERLGYKVSPRVSGSMVTPTADQVDARLRDLANFTLELKEVVRELFLAIAARPSAAPPPTQEA
jgi:hypothetical protein